MRRLSKWCVFVLVTLGAGAAHADTVLVFPTKDASIYSESTTLANGLGAGIFSGRTNDGFERRALLEFNVDNVVPPFSTVTAVELRLHVTQSNTGPLTVGLHRLTADWSEGPASPGGNGGTGFPAAMMDATWSERQFMMNQPWATPGGDFLATPSATTDVGGIGSTFEWSSAGMVADVQAWLDNPTTNHGWILVSQTTASGQAKRYASREFTEAALRPVLEITFVPSGPTGACCLADGSCATVLDPGAACTGIYQGNATTCATTTCPQPPGACCIADADATCLYETAADCATQGGTFQGNFVACATDLCPVVPTPFIDPLPIPKVATPTSGMPGETAAYELSFVEIQQQLHSELPPTTVWGFDDGTGPGYPGPTIEATSGEQVDVNWINDLRDSNGQLRTSHYLPVDTCPHGAEDEARAVMHLHGAHVPSVYDGYPYFTLNPGENDLYQYPNEQSGATLWYHDHSIGTTRLGVQMGLAGFYLLRNPNDDALDLPDGPYEIPMAIQDRQFNVDGSLRYPANHEEHVVGNVVLVNGKVWPFLNVARGKYRFRWLNGSGSRAYRLSLSNDAGFHQIGSDGGFLEAPVPVSEVLLMPGERADVVVDFAAYQAGTVIDLLNDAPSPYPGSPGPDDIPNVMRFIVQSQSGHTAPLPATLAPVDLPLENEAALTRDFELARMPSPCSSGMWTINGLMFDDIVEMPQLGTSEVWRFINKSGLAHPMHMHLVMFRVLDRQPFTIVNGQVVTSGPPVPPIETERGYKDTVRVDPNEIVRVVARFENHVGNYAYHCHILEHEDNEMMRQFTTVTECGDGAVGMPGEECDDGNYNTDDACPDGPSGTCVPAFCGDGYRWTNGGTEECDAAGETMFCDLNCTNAFCGDNDLNVTAGEQCDDGNMNMGDGCSPYCQLEEPMTGGGGSGAGEPSGGAAAGGAPASGGSVAQGAGPGSGGAAGGAADDGGIEEGACNCRLSDPRPPHGLLSVLALAALGAARSQRRRARR
jgi:spore coat protein A, manganese oxidase